MKTYRIMTDNQKAFHRDGELSEIIKGMGDFTIMTAVRIDKTAAENCGTCKYYDKYNYEQCRLNEIRVPKNDHCQSWSSKND